MPAVQRSEFSLALNQVASERGVDVEVVLETVENAILAAYRKDHAGVEVEEFRAELNPNTGEAKIFHGDKDVTPPGFGRIAAQTAKQVILQKIREKEKEAIFSDYRVKVGTIVNGMILRFAGPNIIVDIGKTEAIMPPPEQVTSEKYSLNQRLSFYLLEIREGMKGEEIVVSRSANGLVEGLFKREVPEVAQGSVEIKAIVREPGHRTKIAVFSTQPGIDPVGSCVGQKGVRVQSIIQELGGVEKVDIIQWAEDPKMYIAQALSPAKNVQVDIDDKEKVAHVTVPTEELSLAIGKEGQNVRLAHKLTGYRIEIEGAQAPEVPIEAEASADTTEDSKTEESKSEPKKTAESKTPAEAAPADTADATAESEAPAEPAATEEISNSENADQAQGTPSDALSENSSEEDKPEAVPAEDNDNSGEGEEKTEKSG
jgi:transcription termination/antitermination protein NusA